MPPNLKKLPKVDSHEKRFFKSCVAPRKTDQCVASTAIEGTKLS